MDPPTGLQAAERRCTPGSGAAGPGREREALAALRERAAAIRANSVDRERFYRERVGGYDSGELFTTIEAVEAMVRAPGLRPGARRITREAVPRTSLERLQFTLPLEGSYPQLVGFLRNVENSTRFIAVDGIGMRAAEQRGAALQVQLSAYLKTPSAAVEKRGARAR